jgi:hypothetical protein
VTVVTLDDFLLDLTGKYRHFYGYQSLYNIDNNSIHILSIARPKKIPAIFFPYLRKSKKNKKSWIKVDKSG